MMRKETLHSTEFSGHLKEVTRKVHSVAEQTTFIKGFLKGTASHESYLQLLVDLQPVYEAMEDELVALTKNDEAYVSAFCFPELFRSAALAQDIHFLHNLIDERIEASPSQAALNYAQRIRTVSKVEPVLLIGHLYTRYLGDLSGGQILSRIAQRSMGLSVGRGLDFYEFDEIESCAAMKQQFRAALDLLDDASDEVRAAVCDEAILAFKFNIRIFEGLKGNAFLSLFRNLPGVPARVLPAIPKVA